MSIETLAIKNLHFGYKNSPRNAITNISLCIEKGASLGLIGMNGAGKTTLVSLIMGLIKPNMGSIHINGTPARLGRSDTALVPQEYAFYDKLTTLENLNYFASVIGLKGNDRLQKIQQVMQDCNLVSLKNRKSHSYSGGEKRRLNLAIALLKRYELLILDEPTANVDPHSRAIIVELIKQQQKLGTTIIYTSHLLSEVESLCQSVALLHNSELKLSGNLHELLTSHSKVLTVQLSNDDVSKLKNPPHWLTLNGNTLTLDLDSLNISPAAILLELENFSLNIDNIHYGQQSLETIFMNLTQTSQSYSKR